MRSISVPMRMTLLAALALGACAPSTEWFKEGATPADLRFARESCAREADRFGFLQGGQRRTFEQDAPLRQAQGADRDAFRVCMETRGWRRERV